jgi:hypothetical protein
MTLSISVLTPPPMIGSSSDEPGGDVEDLATALSLHTKTPVPILRGYLKDAPPERFLIAVYGEFDGSLAACDPRGDVAARTIILDAMWPNVFRFLEEHQLAGAVDMRRYYDWRFHPESDTGNGMFGLISVAERAGMRWESGKRFGSESYGGIGCPDHCRDLPSLLVHYLTVYEEMGLHLRRATP